MTLSFLFLVGITGLEPATSRPPDVCATNCKKLKTKSIYPVLFHWLTLRLTLVARMIKHCVNYLYCCY